MNIKSAFTKLLMPPELAAFSENPAILLQNKHERHGDLVTLALGRHKVLSVRDPSLARFILKETNSRFAKNSRFRKILGSGIVVSENPLWERQHELFVKLFASGLLNSIRANTESEISRLLPRWVAAKKPVDIEPDCLELTFHVITQAMFGQRFSKQTFQSMQRAITLGARLLHRQWLMPLEVPHWIPGSTGKALDKIRLSLHAFCEEIYEKVSTSSSQVPFRLIVEACDRAQAVDEIKSILIAGHETVAQGIGWTLMLLAHHAPWQSQLRDLASSESPGFIATAKNVYKESLRLYPPIWLIVREALKSCQYEDKKVAQGGLIFISPYCIHRDAKFWREPESFDPRRYEGTSTGNPAYLPFGAGPRMCLGIAMANEQAHIILRRVLLDVTMTPVNGAMPIPHGGAVLRPIGGALIRFSPIR